MDEAEQEQLIDTWNLTEMSYPDKLCVHELFVGQAEQTPDAIAILRDHNVATVGASGANAGGLLEEPYSQAMMEILAFERAHRADVGGADGVVIVEAAVIDVEHRAVAKVENG